jgi:hypothetical protein
MKYEGHLFKLAAKNERKKKGERNQKEEILTNLSYAFNTLAVSPLPEKPSGAFACVYHPSRQQYHVLSAHAV